MVIRRREISESEVLLEVTTNINDETVAEFRGALYAELDQPHSLIQLDLEKVRSMNSAALGALLLFQKKARDRGKGLRISRCSGELHRTLLAIRMDRIVEMPGEPPPTIEN